MFERNFFIKLAVWVDRVFIPFMFISNFIFFCSFYIHYRLGNVTDVSWENAYENHNYLILVCYTMQNILNSIIFFFFPAGFGLYIYRGVIILAQVRLAFLLYLGLTRRPNDPEYRRSVVLFVVELIGQLIKRRDRAGSVGNRKLKVSAIALLRFIWHFYAHIIGFICLLRFFCTYISFAFKILSEWLLPMNSFFGLLLGNFLAPFFGFFGDISEDLIRAISDVYAYTPDDYKNLYYFILITGLPSFFFMQYRLRRQDLMKQFNDYVVYKKIVNFLSRVRRNFYSSKPVVTVVGIYIMVVSFFLLPISFLILVDFGLGLLFGLLPHHIILVLLRSPFTISSGLIWRLFLSLFTYYFPGFDEHLVLIIYYLFIIFSTLPFFIFYFDEEKEGIFSDFYETAINGSFEGKDYKQFMDERRRLRGNAFKNEPDPKMRKRWWRFE